MSRRGRPALLATALACVCAWAVGASPAAAATPEALRACIIENLPRYDHPDRALVAQYADVETACRAALDGSESVDVDIVPSGGDRDAAGAAGSEGPAPPSQSGPAAPDGQGGDAPARRDGSPGTPQDPAGGGGATAAGSVAEAVALADDGGEGSSASPLGGAPWWLLALGAGLLAAVAGGVIVELRRPQR